MAQNFTSLATNTRAHKHDCDCCTHHGALIDFQLNVHDVYTCGDSVVIRHASDGPDYSSLPKAIVEQIAEDGDGMYGTAWKLIQG